MDVKLHLKFQDYFYKFLNTEVMSNFLKLYLTFTNIPPQLKVINLYFIVKAISGKV